MTALVYLKEHSLDPNFVKDQLGWQWDEQKIIIPIYNQAGKLLFCKYRWLITGQNQPKFTADKGSHPTLYGLHRKEVQTNKKIIVCEGEADCARLLQAGIPAVTSTGGVQKFDEPMAQVLVGKQIDLFLDNDKAGINQTKKTAEVLKSVGISVKIGKLPAKIKDICEFFAKNDKKLFKNLQKQTFSLAEWWQKNKPEEYSRITAGELLKMEFPPEQWLIDRIVPLEGFTFIFGSPGTGKSYLTLSMAKALVDGWKWLDKFEVPRKGKVLFLDKENPKATTHRRIKGLRMFGDNVSWIKYPEKFSLVNQKGELSEFALSLAQDVREENIDMIILDSFVDFMIGSENSSTDTQAFFDVFRQLFPNKAIVILHHENKPSPGVMRNSSQKLRGSSNITAQAYTEFRIHQMPNKKTEIIIEQTKTREELKLDKMLIEMEIGEDDEGGSFVSGFKYLGEVADEAGADKVADAWAEIEELLANAPVVTKKEIVGVCSAKEISLRSVERALTKMKKEDVIEEIKNVEDKRKFSYMLKDNE